MGPLALLVAAAVGYAIYTGKVKLVQMPPILLALGGAFIALRGGWILGIAAIAVGVTWYRGLTWRMFGTRSEQTDEYALSSARWLLGVSANDGADRIRTRHRQLISENHPDRGGSEERAAELNKARDLLLEHLNARTLEQ
jgi:hypothetical protein